MSKTRLLVLMCFLLTFSAGVAVGLVAAHMARPPHRGSWMAHKLGLSSEQREQMRQIWSEVHRVSWRERRARRETLVKERDAAIRALFTEEQLARYEKVLEAYAEKVAEQNRQREAVFKKAIERTKQMLTDEQRQAYEKMMKERAGRGPRPPFGRPGSRDKGHRPPPPPPPFPPPPESDK